MLGRFIRRTNARFAKVRADPQSAWRHLPKGFDWDYHFLARETRKMRSDHSLSWLGQTLALQVKMSEPVLAGKTVTVHQLPDGSICVMGQRRLAHREVEEPPARKW